MNIAMNVVFVGGGNMADALIGGMLKSGFSPGQLRAIEVDGAARRRLFEKYHIECIAESRGMIRAGEVVVFAVKPQQMQEAARFSGLKPNANLVVSIAAGVTLASLAGWLGGPNMSHTKLVRAMPNTPALIGAGVAGLYALPGVSEAERKQAEAILGAVGGTVWIEDEALMDAVTAVSGSGPAYVFWFIEQLARSGESLGLAPETARKLALETVLGAATLAAQSADSPATLRERVTSKGGTTEAALKAFEEQKLAERLLRAIEAARDRGAELGRQLAKD
ncbi:MAG TPA: pyrroline-5-carboxylate reductase [Burkholderiales bacterium]|nr:pyrroline-5-carboxylate reductase [Burkholderiales bacterium]